MARCLAGGADWAEHTRAPNRWQKMKTRAAKIAAHRGDWAPNRWQKMKSEQPRSQHTEGMGFKSGGKTCNKTNSQDRSIPKGRGSKTDGKRCHFQALFLFLMFLFASLSRLVFLSTCFYVLSSFLFWFFVAHANFVQKTKNFAGGCRPQTPAFFFFFFKNQKGVRGTFSSAVIEKTNC